MPDKKINLKKLSQLFRDTLGHILHKDYTDIPEILAHFANRHSFKREYFDRFLEYYNLSDSNKLTVFSALTSMRQVDVYTFLDKIYAFSDSPDTLLQIRKDLRRLIRSSELPEGIDPADLKRTDAVYAHYLGLIFNYQYLNLNVHGPDNTSINLLKFISEKEGVHPAAHYSQFIYRLNSPDRIIMSLSHFKKPDIPVVYIEIALAPSVFGSIDEVLSADSSHTPIDECRAAVFYSVNRCLDGLEGAGIGEKMILRAGEYIKQAYPRINYLCTLSPVPKLYTYISALGTGEAFLSDLTSVDSLLNHTQNITYFKEQFNIVLQDRDSVFRMLADSSIWFDDRKARKILSPVILALAKEYLLNHRREYKGMTTAFDPVENFHLNNGAELMKINLFADSSDKGRDQSLGVMVNYLYNMDNIENNRLLYHEGVIVHPEL